MKFSKPEWMLIGVTILYMILSPFVFIITNDFLHAFLAWNMILALIPFLIAKLLIKFHMEERWKRIILFVLWILFLPNAFYLMTDLIYLSNHVFLYQEHLYADVIYFDHFIPWLALFHIFLGVIISLIWGYHALSIVESVGMKVFSKKLVNGLIMAVLFLSSVGIYIGRFFRYNSWNLLRLYNIILDFIEALSWNMVFFIVGYTVVLITLYFLIKVIKKLEISTD